MTNYDPPSEPKEYRLPPSVRGGHPILEECSECGGTGNIPETVEGGFYIPPGTCPNCNGTGVVWTEEMQEYDE